jgi:hypothetical protein
MFDSCFAESFACQLAMNVCEELTQSNTKMAAIAKMYEDAISNAKRNNAFENRPVKPPEDSWITQRY